MIKLRWGDDRYADSFWHPTSDELGVSSEDVRRDWAAGAIAHELAHRREGILLFDWDTYEQMYWKELAVWEAAMERGLPPEEVSEELIEDSLGGYLGGVGRECGEESLQYREAKKAYESFKRRYL